MGRINWQHALCTATAWTKFWQWSAAGQSTIYLTDRLGSVRKVVNAVTTVNSYEYDSYGRRTAAGTVANPFSYTDREYDAESGLYFYRRATTIHRQGAFISEDPIGLAGGDPPISIPMCATIPPIPSIHQGISASGMCSMWHLRWHEPLRLYQMSGARHRRKSGTGYDWSAAADPRHRHRAAWH